MTDPTAEAAIQGTYADFKIVRSRGVMQMVVEVPIENWKSLVDAFGMPQPGEEIPVAVARLVPGATMRAQPDVRTEKTVGEKAVMRAAILCQDKEFQGWIAKTFGVNGDEESNAAEFIRTTCGISSRAELATNQAALGQFIAMDAEFRQATGRAAENRS